MTTTIAIGPLVALIAGILILIIPRLLNYIIALYLIIIGLLGLFGPPRATVSAAANPIAAASAYVATAAPGAALRFPLS